MPYSLLALGFALLFTLLNLGSVETSARFNKWLVTVRSAVVVVFFGYAIRFIALAHLAPAAFVRPFYDPQTFSLSALSSGTAIAALMYSGFDAL